ncbi:MAG: putative l-lactate permease family protein [Firmicutes bacterium]|nr:putative l-lactate permease family protein [Bacillota bacterium]
MELLSFLTLLPIIIIFLLLTWKNVDTHTSALIGWALCVLVGYFFFYTSFEISMRASVAGIIASFPITLMAVTSILQINFMEATGALKRIAVFLKTLAPSDSATQIMTINLGAGMMLVAAGATPVTVLPPIMVAMGYSKFMSIALPALGFDALCTYSMLGAPLVTYSDFTGVPLNEAAQVFSKYLPVISTLIAFAMMWLVGGFKTMLQGFIPCLLAGLTAGFTAVAIAYIPVFSSGVVLTGIIAGIAVVVVMLLYLKIIGKPIICKDCLTPDELQIEKEMSLLTAFSPWIILIISLLIVNFYLPLTNLLFKEFEMAVSIVPGQVIKIRPLWNAYTWVLISTLLSAIFLKPNKQEVQETIKNWLVRAPKPVLSLAVFFMLGLLMNNTGLENIGGVWKNVDPTHNMVSVLALESADLFGSFYPLITAPLGMFGGFVTSSEASALAMFAKYNILTSDMIHVDPRIVTAATGIGAGLASVCSPGKLQNAAYVIDAFGEENKVMKTTFPISMILVLITAVMCYMLA